MEEDESWQARVGSGDVRVVDDELMRRSYRRRRGDVRGKERKEKRKERLCQRG